MKILETIKKRRSIRKFHLEKEVSEKQVNQLLEAARWAPSAGNLQSWYFMVVRLPSLKEELVRAALGQSFIAQASVVIVSCADLKRSASGYGQRGESLYALQDTTIASQNICLAAVEIGLATTWVGAFDEKKVSQILSLPRTLRPIALLPVGYPAQSPSPPPRRSIKEISKII